MKVSKKLFMTTDAKKRMDNQNYAMVVASESCSEFSVPVTVTYEVDREITIKESDIDKLLGASAGFFERDIELIKQKLFGDSNE